MTKSPTLRLLLGLLITLGAVTGFSAYALYQLHGLTRLQRDTIDLNRHDSLLLLQVQNDVSALGLELRDMMDANPSKIGRFRQKFDGLNRDLSNALTEEANLRPLDRYRNNHEELTARVEHFRDVSDRVFQLAAAGQRDEARNLAGSDLAQQASNLAESAAGLLKQNTEAEERADQATTAIYRGVEKNIYAFMAATIIAIAVTSLYLIYSNRRIFEQLESLSHQRRVLAGRLITVQEEVLRSVSRELHDEFGQILTAVGTMLSRAERKGIPADSPFRMELSEVRQITHNTLEMIRGLSQMLHPAIIDDYGLAKAIEWYAEVFQKQTGIQTRAIIRGEPVRITGQPAIHCFRIVQEALNNAAKHSGSKQAAVEVIFGKQKLTVNVRDFGNGILRSREQDKRGLGLIAMQERAELLSGTLEIDSAPDSGTTVSLVMPFPLTESPAEETEQQHTEEVFSPKS